MPLNFLLLVLLISACAGADSNGAAPTPTSIPSVISTQTALPTVQAGQELFPAGQLDCKADFHNPAKQPHPKNRVECASDGTLTLAEGDQNLAEDDLVRSATFNRLNYVENVTVDLTKAGQTEAGLLVESKQGVASGYLLVVRADGTVRLVDASLLDKFPVDSLPSLGAGQIGSVASADITIARGGQLIVVYANDKLVFIAAGLTTRPGGFGFLALAPLGTEDADHLVVFSGIKISTPA